MEAILSPSPMSQLVPSLGIRTQQNIRGGM